jgi:hypothetical protein
LSRSTIGSFGAGVSAITGPNDASRTTSATAIQETGAAHAVNKQAKILLPATDTTDLRARFMILLLFGQ